MPVWLRLSIGGAATLLVGMALGRFSYATFVPALIEAGALTAAEAGTVGAFNLAGFLAGALAARGLRRRLGEVGSLRVCLLLALLCLVASILPLGFAWLAFWRFLVGAAVGVMMIYSLAIVTRHAPPDRLGAATGIVFTGVGVGILLSGTLVPLLLGYGLAAAWSGIALIGVAGVWIAFWGWRVADGAGVARPRQHEPPMEWSRVIRGLVATRVLFSLGLIPHSIYWVDYLVRGLGHDMAFGGLHWALFGLGALSGTYLWGRFADVVGFRAGLVLVFAALAVGVALPVLFTAGWALVASSLVVGAQPGFSAIISGRTHQLVGAGRMPEVWRWMSLIGGIGQAVGGYAYVALFGFAESYVPLYLAGGATMALGAVISLGLRGSGPEPFRVSG